MKITVLGGSGFIGRHVVEALGKAGHRVLIYDLKKKITSTKKNKFLKGNINNAKSLSKAIKSSNIVYNFAALADIDEAKKKPLETIKVNIEGCINILKICKKYKIKKLIHASSIYANSKEGSYYAISKRAAEDYIEEYCKLNKLKFTILRFGSLYGEGADSNNGIQKIITRLIKKKELIHRGEKKAARKYINVKDAASYCAKVIIKKYDNKYLNITGHKTIKIYDLLKKLSKKYKIKKKIKFLNEKNTSHYNIRPTQYKMREGLDLLIKSKKNFFESVYQAIDNIKKK